jgi:ribosomal protein L7/L12
MELLKKITDASKAAGAAAINGESRFANNKGSSFTLIISTNRSKKTTTVKFVRAK